MKIIGYSEVVETAEQKGESSHLKEQIQHVLSENDHELSLFQSNKQKNLFLYIYILLITCYRSSLNIGKHRELC